MGIISILARAPSAVFSSVCCVECEALSGNRLDFAICPRDLHAATRPRVFDRALPALLAGDVHVAGLRLL